MGNYLRSEKEKMKNKPDWKNPQDYVYLNDLGPNQWAWEFLRRNPKYIADWKRWNKKYSKIPDYTYLPEGYSKSSSKWYIYLMRDPGKIYPDYNNDPDGIQFFSEGGYDTVLMTMSKREKKLLYWGFPDLKTGKISFTFNFYEPLEPQLNLVKKRLKELQQRAKEEGQPVRTAFKPRIDEWKMLLRIFDAKISGVKNKEIAETIFPGKCLVDGNATECPLENPKATLLNDKDMSKCPLSEEALDDAQCSLKDPSAGIKKVHDKYLQAKKYVEHDYRLIPFLNSEI